MTARPGTPRLAPDAFPRRVEVGLCGPNMKLADYPARFGVLEVQQTFYQPPRLGTLQRWRATVPESFEFTIKAWQLITHPATSPTYRRLRRPLTPRERADAGGFRATAIVNDGWLMTVACAIQLGATAILFQCPASFRPTKDNAVAMRGFFDRIDRPTGVRLMWEPRGPWPADLVRSLCGDLDLVHVVDPFVTTAVTSAPTYFRLHGISGVRHVYTDDELATLRDMLPETGEVYVLFNNMTSAADATRFQRLLADKPHRVQARAAR